MFPEQISARVYYLYGKEASHIQLVYILLYRVVYEVICKLVIFHIWFHTLWTIQELVFVIFISFHYMFIFVLKVKSIPPSIENIINIWDRPEMIFRHIPKPL